MAFYLKLVLCALWAIFYTSLLLLCLPFLFLSKNNFTRWGRGLSWGSELITGIKIQGSHPERVNLHKPCLFMGNHQSIFDVVSYCKFIPDNCIAIGKWEIVLIPIVGWCFALTGGLLLRRKKRETAVAQLKQVAVSFRKNKLSSGVMPEGTRNPNPKKLLPFKKGPFHLAVQSEAWIVPIVCDPILPVLDVKNRKVNPGTLHIHFLEPIATIGMTEAQVPQLMETVRSIMQNKIDERFALTP